ncbi:MAG TPA: hypothetical protein VHW64_18335 [Nocardioides sp.]|uniref:hypothetical protein n=1 Tax=Nocardioides sp. TaxID=35761 RepID=UPI002E30603D|nr:hypothetical protein [Nocardioides sp.]HEX3932660.1 hypothetical protein [Nocardioides sp.]
MNPHLPGRILPVVIGAAAVVGGANLASYAADGHAFRLGAKNHEDHATTVTNDGAGPAFRFATADGVAPFAVSSSTKVAHLNATRVDGLKAGDLSRSYRYVVPTGTSGDTGFQATDLPPGHYNVSFDLVTDNHAPAGAPPPLCFVTDSRREFAVVAGAQVVAGTAIIDGTGPVTVLETGAAALVCEANGGLTSPVGVRFRNTLTFTLVRSVHRGTLRSLASAQVEGDARQWRGR